MDIDEIFKQITGNKKIQKGKTYTHDEIKNIFENARNNTIKKPAGKAGERLKKEGKMSGVEAELFEMKLSMESIIVLHTLEENMFEEEK